MLLLVALKRADPLVSTSSRRAKSAVYYPGRRGWTGGEEKPGGGYGGVPTGAMRGVEEDEPPLKDGGEEVVSGIMSIMTIALIRSLMRSDMLSLWRQE